MPNGLRALPGGRRTGRLDIPFGEFMPPEFGQRLFEQVELGRQRQEEEQMRQFLENINALGRLHTGTALRGAIGQVLGPAQERRQRLLGDIALQGVGMGREERLGELGFERQRQFAGERETFQERMARFQAEQAMQRLQAELAARAEMGDDRGGFWDILGQQFAGGLGRQLGGRALPGLGQLLGR